MLRVPCGFLLYDCTSHVTSKETFFPHTWSAQHIQQAADLIRQQGKQEWKNPCCWEAGSSLGWAEPAMLNAAASVPFGGQETGWLQVTSHTSSPDQSSGNVNLPSHMAADSPQELLCPASRSFHRYQLKMTPRVLSVPYSRFFWESISAGSAVQLSQLPYGWTKMALFRRIWRSTTDFTSWKVLLYQSCSNSLQLWNPQTPQQTSMFLPCFHKNIFLVFPEILIHYLSKILWLFLRTWPAVFPSGSLLTIMSFSVHIQLDPLQLCAFQWLPNVH